MKKISRENITNLPYSLHDAHINRIKIKKLDANSANIKLIFDEGYYCKEDYLVQGKLLFEKVYLDYSSISIIKVKGNKYERIKGRRYRIDKFCSKFNNVDMEITDETYGFNSTKLTGYMYIKNEIKEFIIDLYHLGNMIYIAEK